MIHSAFFGFFNYVANNRWAQVVVGAGVLWLIWTANNSYQRKAGARRYKVRAEKQARRAQDQVRETLDEKSAQTRAARATVEPVDSAGELSDRLHALIISD